MGISTLIISCSGPQEISDRCWLISNMRIITNLSFYQILHRVHLDLLPLNFSYVGKTIKSILRVKLTFFPWVLFGIPFYQNNSHFLVNRWRNCGKIISSVEFLTHRLNICNKNVRREVGLWICWKGCWMSIPKAVLVPHRPWSMSTWGA